MNAPDEMQRANIKDGLNMTLGSNMKEDWCGCTEQQLK
jgi:hypothetical protein